MTRDQSETTRDNATMNRLVGFLFGISRHSDSDGRLNKYGLSVSDEPPLWFFIAPGWWLIEIVLGLTWKWICDFLQLSVPALTVGLIAITALWVGLFYLGIQEYRNLPRE